MYKEGDFTLLIPQTSRKRGETWIEVFLSPRGSLSLSQLPSKEIAPPVVGAK